MEYIKQHFNKDLVFAVLVLMSRFLGFPANFSPVGSYGFLTQKWWLFAATILIFDFVKGGFYPGFLFTYLGFAGYVLFAKLAQKKLSNKLFFLPVASTFFFIMSNLGVWWFWYSHTVPSLTMCYVVALPFFMNTVLSDLLFGYGSILIKHFFKNTKIEFQPSTAFGQYSKTSGFLPL